MLIKIIENGLFGIITEKLSLTAESLWFWILMLLAVIFSMAAGYFLGSLNAAIIISRKKYKNDIRNHGSGNAGMTNMFRTFGKTGGFLTLFGDIAKTILPICFGYLFFGYAGAYISGLFVVMGHCFPIYYRFKGGKGVLAMFAMMLVCDPPVFLLMALVFAIIAIGTRFVSLASVMTAIFTPLFIDLWYTIMYGDGATAGFRMPIAFLITVVIVARHASNLKRIMAREEPRLRMPWEKKNDK
jgi:glycerol-3-phosphate acyltransferase PlsY